MRLSKFTDYAFRVLILAARRDGIMTIDEARSLSGISEGHLKKVVRTLAHGGFLSTSRGRGGGFGLARDAAEIRLSEVLALTETDFALVECLRADGACPISENCGLAGLICEARAGFMAPFVRATLADLS